MKKIISLQLPTDEIDVNREFRYYKYAIPEHEPIELSNGMWLHTYRVTSYDDFDPHGDFNEELQAYNENL
jgi:hypothetical protein